MEPAKLTLDDVFVEWVHTKALFVKESTLAAYCLNYKNHLKPAFGNVSGAIEESEVQNFVLDKLRSGMSRKTVSDVMIVLKMVYRFGVKLHDFEARDWEIKWPTLNNEEGVNLPVMDVGDQRRLMAYLRENFSAQNFGLLLVLSTGMRIGEISALQFQDIDLDNKCVLVRKTIERIYVPVDPDMPYGRMKTKIVVSSPKTFSSRRAIPLTKELLEYAKHFKKLFPGHYYVTSCSDSPIEPRTYRNVQKRVFKHLGIPPMKFHGLRHSFATRCIESGCDYKTISTILGHTKIGTTLDLYVHPSDENKLDAINKMMKKQKL